MDALFADILDQGLDLRLKVTGRSMRPFVNSGETVLLRKVPSASLQRRDIIYFIDAEGSAVLHRIISREIGADGRATFSTRGDALLMHDAPITEDGVLAKAIYVEKVLPLIGPVQLAIDSGFCKSLHAVYGLYRNMRHTFLNRTAIRKVFQNR